MTYVNIDEVADAMGLGQEASPDFPKYGNIKSINSDGSYQVQLNASATTTRCAKLCDANVGDRVLVERLPTGKCAAVGRVGGDVKVEGHTHTTVKLTGGNGNTSGYRLVSRFTVGELTNCRLVLSSANRHSGCGIVCIGFSSGSPSTAINGTPEVAVYGSSTQYSEGGWVLCFNSSKSQVSLYWKYGDYNSGSFTVMENLGWPELSNGEWVTSIPADAGTQYPAKTVVDMVKLTAYPVGAVYISYVSTSPASLFGGTWTAITGRFPYFNAGTATGGSNTHTLSVNEIPKHRHDARYFSGATPGGWVSGITGWNDTGSGTGWMAPLAETGGGAAHNNMPAYQTLYAWRRTA